ncbi:MAG TPA: pyridoxal phosphate-dependent aminotransferase [Labilithrix sp.]|nr:pyridoxal phosphate-dependent aminotransferase [Labilithrix sp.]
MTKRGLADAARRIRPAVFAELQSRIDRLAARGEELIPLHIGDTFLAPPAAARRVLGGLEPDDATLHRYGGTAGVPALREAFAHALRRRGLDYDPATEILVGNGGTHALFCGARTVLDPGDEVILAAPFWPLAPGVLSACGAIPIDVPLTQRLYEDPAVDPAVVLASALTPKTKAVYFISPNNPDGKVLTAAQLGRIADFAREHDLWVFADEVYSDIVFGGHESSPSIAALPGMHERTIVLHSLSKNHALAGLRVGFITAPEPVITTARRVSTHTAFNVSVAMQRVALAALEDESFPAAARDAYRSARDAAASALAGAPIRFHVAEGATYLFLDFAPAIASRGGERPLFAILERAVDRGVLLAPGDAFGSAYARSFARLCFTSVPTDRVVVGIERLRAAVDAYLADEP